MTTTNRHTFDATRPWHLFLHDAYQGGRHWDNPASGALGTATLYGYRVVTTSDNQTVVVEEKTGAANSYLVPWPGETLANFERRRLLAVYINLVEPVVDTYVDSVTSRVTRDLGEMTPYLSNLDGDGQSWREMITSAARNAALDGVCALILDAPPVNSARTRAEEIEQGVSLRAVVVARPSWAWLRMDADGCVEEFAYTDELACDGTTRTVRFWVWTRAAWAVYDHSVSMSAALTDYRDRVLAGKPARTGAVSPRLGGRLPVVFCYHRRNTDTRIPEGKSLAASPAGIGRQVYNLLSAIEDTHRRAPPFVAMPTAAKGGGLEPEVKAVAAPDHTVPVPAGSGMPQWVTFPPESLKDLREHALALISLAFRVSGLEVQADASAQVQSGEALRVRSRGFEVRAQKFAEDVRGFELRALSLAGLYLTVNSATASVTYPSRYVLGDTSDLLNAALVLLDKVSGYLGPEGVTTLIRQALGAATALDDAEVERVVAEVTAKFGQEKAPTADLNSFNTPWARGNEIRATMGLPPVEGGDVVAALEEQRRAAAAAATAELNSFNWTAGNEVRATMSREPAAPSTSGA